MRLFILTICLLTPIVVFSQEVVIYGDSNVGSLKFEVFNEKSSEPKVFIDNNLENRKFRISPNPANKDVTIENSLDSKVNLSIVDVNGSVVKNKPLTKGDNTVSLNELSVGSYIFVFRYNNKIIEQQIIQKVNDF